MIKPHLDCILARSAPPELPEGGGVAGEAGHPQEAGGVRAPVPVRGAARAQVRQPADGRRHRRERPLDARLLGRQGRPGIRRRRDLRLQRHQPAMEGRVQGNQGGS